MFTKYVCCVLSVSVFSWVAHSSHSPSFRSSRLHLESSHGPLSFLFLLLLYITTPTCLSAATQPSRWVFPLFLCILFRSYSLFCSLFHWIYSQHKFSSWLDSKSIHSKCDSLIEFSCKFPWSNSIFSAYLLHQPYGFITWVSLCLTCFHEAFIHPSLSVWAILNFVVDPSMAQMAYLWPRWLVYSCVRLSLEPAYMLSLNGAPIPAELSSLAAPFPLSSRGKHWQTLSIYSSSMLSLQIIGMLCFKGWRVAVGWGYPTRTIHLT